MTCLIDFVSGDRMFASLKKLLQDSSLPIWILSFYVFIWYMQIGDRFGILGAIRIEFIVGSLLIILSLMAVSQPATTTVNHYSGLIRAIVIFYLILIIYTFCSYNSQHSQTVFFDRVLKFSMFTLFIGALVRNEAELKLVLLGYFLAMFKIIQEGLVGGIGGGLVWENQGIPRLHGVTKMYVHPNSLSGLAVSALPFFIFLLPYQKRFIQLIFLGGIIGLLYIVMTTGSRTGYIATAVLFICLLLRVGIFKPKTLMLLALSFTVMVAVVPQSYKDRFGTMFKSKEEMGGSANKRLEIIEDAWAISLKYPLGVGIQAFPYVRGLEFGREQDTHNLYLEVLTNLGPIGFIAFFAFIIAIFKVNLKSRKIFLQEDRRFLAELCYVVNLYILCRLVLGLFGMDLYEVYWWFAAGMTISLAKIASGLPAANKIIRY